MQRRSGTDERVEERLAVLLRPGPRRALVEPDAVDDTLIGDRAADQGPRVSDRAKQGIDPDEQDADPDDQETGLDESSGDALDHDRPEVEVLRPATDAAEWLGRRSSGSISLGTRLRALLPIDHLGAFGRPQLVVIAVIVLVGLLFGGWAILRARPVAIAAPQSGSTTHAGPSASLSPSAAVASPTPSGTPSAAPPSGPATSPSTMIKVHILGAVRDPGVVTLPSGSRVQDGLDKAGGVKKSADLGDLNLAQPLLDGQQVFIGRGEHGSEVRGPDTAAGRIPSSPTSSGAGSSDPGSGSAPPAGRGTGPVDLNTATLDQLDALPGVGPVTAQKILDWRTEHGRFSSAEELQEVDGIGPKTYADLAPQVTV